MKSNTKDKKIIEGLSRHLFHVKELGTYYLFLAQQAQKMGMLNFSKYLKELSDDKSSTHKTLIYEYLNKLDVLLDPKVQKEENMPLVVLDSAEEIIDKLYESEENDRARVEEFADLCFDLKDHETYSFWKWFIDDALKDLDEVRNIKDAFEMAKQSSKCLLIVDMRIKELMEAEEDGNECK